jgi:DNA adenine methylase
MNYIGGKSQISKWFIPFIPNDIETYLEVFGGMGWTYFNMDLSKYPNLKKIVYNDYNPLNYNLFKCVQNPSLLKKYLDEIPVQQYGETNTPSLYKEQFTQFQNEIYHPNLIIDAPNYEIAAKYVYVLTQVFSGSKPETASFIDLKGKYKSKYITFKNKLTNPKWIDSFLKITDIENMDFKDVIQKYDCKDTFIYCDPPYFTKETYYSNHNFTRLHHEILSNTLKNVEGKFLLSYYDFDLLSEWFPKSDYNWDKKEFNKASAAKKGNKQTKAEELIIMNYTPLH